MKPPLQPIMVASCAAYLALVSLSLLDVELLYVAWPYPLMLSLQKWVPADTIGGYIAWWVIGLAMVSAWAQLLQRALDRSGSGRTIMLVAILAMSVVAWLIPLQLALRGNVAYGVISVTGLLALGSFLYFVFAAPLAGWSRVRALGPLATIVALTSWYLPLFALQAVTMGIAVAAGWPVGE